MTIVLDHDRALLSEECLVVTANLPYLSITIFACSFQDLNWFTHQAEDEGEDHLGGASTPNIDIHHHNCVLLEYVVLLVD